MKIALKRFYLNGSHPGNSLSIIHGHTIGFHQQTQKFEQRTEQIAACESTAEEVTFEWSHHRISSTDSNVRTTYKTNSTI